MLPLVKAKGSVRSKKSYHRCKHLSFKKRPVTFFKCFYKNMVLFFCVPSQTGSLQPVHHILRNCNPGNKKNPDQRGISIMKFYYGISDFTNCKKSLGLKAYLSVKIACSIFHIL